MKLIQDKKYICRVLTYDSVLGRGMLRFSNGAHAPFRQEEIEVNLTQPGNRAFDAHHMVVFRFNLDRRFELSTKPFYFGGCV